MKKPVALLLEDTFVRLEPLVPGHRAALAALADDPVRWEFGPLDEHGGPFAAWAERWFDEAEAQQNAGTQVVFVVRDVESGRVAGSTRYLNFEPKHGRLEIGSTFYATFARGSWVNPACKRLLLAHAFEELGAFRAELKCDARNVRSRAAIAGIGAKEEGTLRRHMVLGDGYVRDTVYFSVLDHEWPAVKAALDERLATARAPAVDPACDPA